MKHATKTTKTTAKKSTTKAANTAPAAPGLHRLSTKQEAGDTVLMLVAELTQAMSHNQWGFAHRLLVVAESIMTGREPSENDLCKNRPGETAPVNRAAVQS